MAGVDPAQPAGVEVEAAMTAVANWLAQNWVARASLISAPTSGRFEHVAAGVAVGASSLTCQAPATGNGSVRFQFVPEEGG
jgi:hypothetical protein